MNSNDLMSLSFILIGMAVAYATIIVIRVIRLFIEKVKFEKMMETAPRLIPYSDYNRCRQPHEWTDVILRFKELESEGQHKVCLNCGIIMSNTKHMLSSEAVVQLKAAAQVAEIRKVEEEQLNQRIHNTVDFNVEAFILSSFPEASSNDTLLEKLKMISFYTMDAEVKAREKVLAEEEGVKQAEDLYEGWADKIKGNA